MDEYRLYKLERAVGKDGFLGLAGLRSSSTCSRRSIWNESDIKGEHIERQWQIWPAQKTLNKMDVVLGRGKFVVGPQL